MENLTKITVVLNQEENNNRKDILNHIYQNFPNVTQTSCIINTIKNMDIKKISIDDLFDYIRIIESMPDESELLKQLLRAFTKKFTNTKKETSDDYVLEQEILDIIYIDRRAKKLFSIIIEICGGIPVNELVELFLDSYMSPGDANYGILIDYINLIKKK